MSVSPDGRAGITASLVTALLADQAPQWAVLPVEPVPVDGWDNRTYHLGADFSVRLPTAERYAPAVAKESRWLPILAPHLPAPVPEPVFTGRPGTGYPYPWSVRRWLPGTPATASLVRSQPAFAEAVGQFLLALQAVPADAGPLAGEHSFHRGSSLAHYDDETRSAAARLGSQVPVARALDVWSEALEASYDGPPVWFHGDVAVGNLLVDDAGSLAAVIDFGTCGVGDPACDLVLAWTFLDAPARAEFRSTVGADDAMWARARGWALWKALITLVGDPWSSADVVETVLAG
jgi:aminoglycoside phosphotransferase (APT) family kinase protein